MKLAVSMGVLLSLTIVGCGQSGSEGFAADEAPITNGVRDNGAHPSTGGIVAFKPSVNAVVPRCSGTLISPTVFLTAAHCRAIVSNGVAEVTFADVYVHGTSQTFTGTYVAHPEFRGAQSDPHDIAVIVFDAPVAGITPAALPVAGSLNNLPRDQPFTSVGYGAQDVGPGGATTSDGARWMSVGTLNATNPAWLHLSQNAATGDGGTCFGDSGGPNFLGAGASETSILAATTIKGDGMCVASNVAYRLDTASARAFLALFVQLP